MNLNQIFETDSINRGFDSTMTVVCNDLVFREISVTATQVTGTSLLHSLNRDVWYILMM